MTKLTPQQIEAYEWAKGVEGMPYGHHSDGEVTAAHIVLNELGRNLSMDGVTWDVDEHFLAGATVDGEKVVMLGHTGDGSGNIDVLDPKERYTHDEYPHFVYPDGTHYKLVEVGLGGTVASEQVSYPEQIMSEVKALKGATSPVDPKELDRSADFILHLISMANIESVGKRIAELRDRADTNIGHNVDTLKALPVGSVVAISDSLPWTKERHGMWTNGITSVTTPELSGVLDGHVGEGEKVQLLRKGAVKRP